MTWTTVRYDDEISFADFECEEPALNDYLHNKAVHDHQNDLCTLYLLVDEKKIVGGFYVLSNGSIQRAQLPSAKKRRGLPGYPLGTVHIGRLARHKSLKGMRLGEKLMFSALETAVESSTSSASWAITVDAKNDRAQKFYEDYGFEPLKRDTEEKFPIPMYLRMKDARLIVDKQ